MHSRIGSALFLCQMSQHMHSPLLPVRPVRCLPTGWRAVPSPCPGLEYVPTPNAYLEFGLNLAHMLSVTHPPLICNTSSEGLPIYTHITDCLYISHLSNTEDQPMKPAPGRMPIGTLDPEVHSIQPCWLPGVHAVLSTCAGSPTGEPCSTAHALIRELVPIPLCERMRCVVWSWVSVLRSLPMTGGVFS
jgi:hypothetical protein